MALAMCSMNISKANIVCGEPKPLNAAVGIVFVT